MMVLASGLLLPNLNRGGLSGYDDALYAQEGKEMLRSGDWWTVHFNGQPNYEYPPVFLWMEAVSMKIFGVNDYAAKLPSAAAGLGTIAVLYFLTAELTADLWLATAAMFVLTTSQLFVKYATHAMTDVPFTFFVTLSLYCYVKGLTKNAYLMAAGLPVALAILTRSVIGVFPLAVMAADLVLAKRYRLLLSYAACCVVALGLPLIWFGFPPRPEHVAFLAGKVGHAPWRPSVHVLEYSSILLRFYWPWLPLLLLGAVIQVRARALLPLVWFVVLVLPLSLASTKYARYLIPAFPALALMTASGIDRIVPPPRRGIGFQIACFALLALDVITAAVPANERAIDMRVLAPVAERNTPASERVVVYTGGAAGYDTQNQLLWYSRRYTELITDSDQLAAEHDRTVVIDKTSLGPFEEQVGPARVRLLGESERFVCVRVS